LPKFLCGSVSLFCRCIVKRMNLRQIGDSTVGKR
jgi:hypothetical protein